MNKHTHIIYTYTCIYAGTDPKVNLPIDAVSLDFLEFVSKIILWRPGFGFIGFQV